MDHQSKLEKWIETFDEMETGCPQLFMGTRRLLRLTKMELAARLGTTLYYLSNIEEGISVPTITLLRKLNSLVQDYANASPQRSGQSVCSNDEA